MNPDALPEAVVNLIAGELGVARAKLSPGTRLLHDLGCDGDDATELIERYAKTFGVDLSEFSFQRHFGSEAACNPLAYLYLRLFKPHHLRFVPLTVGDLIEAAQMRSLRSPDRAAV